MWDVILFDLDGTLTDPKEGITKSVAHALKHFGIAVDDPDTLTPFIGPPLMGSFQKIYGLSAAEAQEAIRVYRERFSTVGWAENIPYPGIHDFLAALKAAGKTLMVATSKPEVFAVRILEHFGLARYFDLICGTPLDNPQQTKADVIRTALSRGKVHDLSRAVMVGDRLHDIEGAHEVGIPAIGVLYGYGDRAEHEAHGADHIAEDLSQLQELLLGNH
ncbi:MAG: HAD family hydrolase [Ruminococcaceae bacterium]|nr:HAD family hydrolase [Oscillospiraceae bacterium]